ncbi:chitobiase/beta-hexosaminidase C-terminal domain-containing protein [Runella sp.]|uniref:chitobiase/beta-hexosaminidase C-terminal domain-containing protein n=1 Tax=Runella sp. TaxID=1960881 RepID=UPI003D0A5C71
MPRFQNLTSYLLLAIHALLVFLLVFQDKVTIPAWLQPVGRMHPMLLHLPIGLLILAGLLWVFRKEFEGIGFSKLFGFVLSLTALTAALAALMGFFLSREEGYTAEVLTWHKYTGVGLSFLIYGLVLLHQQSTGHKGLFNLTLTISAVILVITGHFGASLTHGDDYLFPAQKESTLLIVTDDTPVFEAAVQPILKAKCFQCHNEQKTKGELLMTTLAGLYKGGKNGPIWVAGDALNSHIIQRANLPLDDKKHMPPKGKAQLTPQEIDLLTAWIQSGADVKKPLKAFADNDPLKGLAQAFLNKSAGPTVIPAQTYTFEAAAESTLEKLNNPFRTIFPIAYNSPALQADFFVRQAYKPGQLGELSDIKKQLVVLNLSNMPIKDEDLSTIAQFENLEKLNLNNSDITGKTLSELKSLSALTSLSLSGTKVTKEALQSLGKMPNLQEVFVWNTPISEKDIAELKKQNQQIRFELGYIPNESERLKLNPPMLVNEKFILTDQTPVTFKHPLKGITIRYTLDGSTPDTLSSPIYKNPLTLSDYTVVKARATKDKWYASDVVEYSFFKGTYHPALAELINEPNPQYKGEGGHTLINQKKGEASDFKNPAWLGYREKPFEALFTFAQPTPLKTVTMSIGKNLGGFIFPPASVEIWGGNDKAHLTLLQKIQPEQPMKDQPTRVEAIQSQLKAGNYTVIKLIAKPVAKLPAWHPSKGQPAWVFVDEVFFN